MSQTYVPSPESDAKHFAVLSSVLREMLQLAANEIVAVDRNRRYGVLIVASCDLRSPILHHFGFCNSYLGQHLSVTVTDNFFLIPM